MNWELFVARRIYRSQRGSRAVSTPAIRIALGGIAVGMAVMIVSVAVVIGFKHEVRHKVTGLTADMLLTHFDDQKSYETEAILVPDSMRLALAALDGVDHVQRYSTKPGMIMTDDSFQGMVLKGVGQDYDLGYLSALIEEGEMPAFADSASSGAAVISRSLAEKLRLKVGDALYTYYIKDEDVRARRFRIDAIYHTGFTVFDEFFVLTDLHTVNRLNGWADDQMSGLEIVTAPQTDAEDLRQDIVRLFKTQPSQYYLRTVEEANPQIFGWLDLLDLNVWVILILMVGVAGFTMISGLLIIILERTRMIGVLKAMGANNASIRRLFLHFAVMLIGKGMLIGNVVGLALCAVQTHWRVFRLDPSSYYMDYVPVEWNVGWWALLNVAVMVVSVLMLVGPSWLITHIHPAKSIRWE
jgi:lipoprotein-releasing system permease protein